MHQSALLGQGLLWRSLGRSLRGNFCACSARLWLAVGCGRPPATCVQNQFVYKNGLSASRNQQVKTNGAGCRASRELCLRETRAKRQILVRSKFAFLLKRKHKKSKDVRGRKAYNKNNFTTD